MPQTGNTTRIGLLAPLAVAEEFVGNSTWGHWQVRPVSIEKQILDKNPSIQPDSKNGALQRGRPVSLDSGFGSISSADVCDIDHTDAQCIVNGLEKIYNGLFAGGAQLKNLPEARKALESKGSEDLFEVATKYGLQHYVEGIIESGAQILYWCEKTPAPKAPSAFVTASKESDKLRAESDKLTQKANLKGLPSNVAKAIKKNEELMKYKKSRLEPARMEFDRIVYSEIEQLSSYQELKSCLESIKALLPDNVEVRAPIDSTIRTWAFNVLLERSKSLSGIK